MGLLCVARGDVNMSIKISTGTNVFVIRPIWKIELNVDREISVGILEE